MHAPDGLWTDCPDRLTTLGPRSFLCCDLQEKEQQAPRAHHRSTASDTDKLVQAHVECLMSEMKIALDRFEQNLFDTVQECFDDVVAVGYEKGDDQVAAWGQKNDLLVHRWMAMKGYLGVLAKRGVLSLEPYWCEECSKVHY